MGDRKEKALKAVDGLYRFFDCLNEKQRAERDELIKIIKDALTDRKEGI